MELKGSSYLKIIGIIFIILGGISTVLGVLGLIGSGIVIFGGESAVAGVGGRLVAFVLILYLVGAVLELVAGITGVKNCNNPAKADTCLKLGVALLVLSLLSDGSNIVSSGFNAKDVFSLISGTIFPILFCHGAKLNME